MSLELRDPSIMAFTLPTFNLAVDVWLPPNKPSLGAADITGLPCQLYTDSRILGIEQYPAYAGIEVYVPPIVLRTPKAGPIQNRRTIVNDGPGSTNYYLVSYIQDTHVGFPNQYTEAIMYQCNANGTVPATY